MYIVIRCCSNVPRNIQCVDTVSRRRNVYNKKNEREVIIACRTEAIAGRCCIICNTDGGKPYFYTDVINQKNYPHVSAAPTCENGKSAQFTMAFRCSCESNNSYRYNTLQLCPTTVYIYIYNIIVYVYVIYRVLCCIVYSFSVRIVKL